jgi:hypothetical protein
MSTQQIRNGLRSDQGMAKGKTVTEDDQVETASLPMIVAEARW